ncbi:MAG: hypothetical protein J5813_06555 [Candidatus Methanomethylophilaceae archaeon]|nr:hypothetical protein [Candidatus Methanomethylophilaceae archaeon]
MSYSHEDIVSDVEDLNDNELMLLSIVGCAPIKITRIQKLGLFIERVLNPDSGTHGAYHYGAFSDDLDEAASTLNHDGAVAIDQGNYQLTRYGTDLLEEASNDPAKNELITGTRDIASFLNSLSDYQLTKLSYILYPETTGRSLIKDRMSLGKDHYVMGGMEISTGLTQEQLRDRLVKRLERD